MISITNNIARVFSLGGAAVLGAVLLLSGMAAAQLPPLDLFPPAYPTGAAVEKRITEVKTYRYAHSLYQPDFTIEAMARSAAGFASPEQVMLSRVSAMMNADYDGYLGFWDPVGVEAFDDANSILTYDREHYLNQWAGIFLGARMVMRERFDIGDYVIIGWRLVSLKGEDGIGFMAPTVFHRVGDRWLATQDLQDFPLLPLMTGETAQERVTR